MDARAGAAKAHDSLLNLVPKRPLRWAGPLDPLCADRVSPPSAFIPKSISSRNMIFCWRFRPLSRVTLYPRTAAIASTSVSYAIPAQLRSLGCDNPGSYYGGPTALYEFKRQPLLQNLRPQIPRKLRLSSKAYTSKLFCWPHTRRIQ